MARRSSARLRARNSATPQPQKTVELLHDNPLRTPKTAPQLAAVSETEEMPGAFPSSASDDHDPSNDTPSKIASHIANALAGFARTPRNKKPRPSTEEMHPEKFHASTTKPLEEARWLGFSVMAPHTEPPKGVNKWAPGADTPSKSNGPSNAFEFTFRAQSSELSSEAQKMMAEKREEAARIKKDMMRIEEEKQAAHTLQNRKIAKPKGNAGRFSDVHLADFRKMDSISTHPTASRPGSRDQMQDAPTPKMAGPKRSTGVSAGKNTQKIGGKVTHRPASDDEEVSPAKRVRLESPKALSKPPDYQTVKIATPSVQQSRTAPRSAASADRSRLKTPTKSSLARAATARVNKTTMIPSLVRTPSKSASKVPLVGHEAEGHFLSRSPTKIAHMSAKKEATRQDLGSPLLARSPIRSLHGPRSHGASGHAHDEMEVGRVAPLLAQSPAKMAKQDTSDFREPQSKTPLLSRTPNKAPAESNPFNQTTTASGPQTNLTDRFRLLRQSPIKSILRSPQRLYSDDPQKIANGTHLATPPAVLAAMTKNKTKGPFPHVVPATEPIVKHVDFTASTKSDDDSPTPSKAAVIEPQGGMYPNVISYPSLPPHSPLSTMNKARRQTLGPLAFTGSGSTAKDFTFRATPQTSIIFGSSIPAAMSPKPSIRHVSAEPETAASMISRKRKFVSDEADTIDEDDVFRPGVSHAVSPRSKTQGRPDKGSGSDKENDINTANIEAGKASIPRTGSRKSANARSQRQSNVEKADHRPSKKLKRDNTASPARASAVNTTTEVKTPSWAQGTVAQKARAALAAAGRKRHATTAASGAVKKVKAGTTAKAVSRGASTGKQSTGGTDVVSVEKSTDRQTDIRGEKREGGKVVLSRARLDALSQPKRRVGT